MLYFNPLSLVLQSCYNRFFNPSEMQPGDDASGRDGNHDCHIFKWLVIIPHYIIITETKENDSNDM